MKEEKTTQSAPAAIPLSAPQERYRPNWVNISFLTMVHLLAVAAILYSKFINFSWYNIALMATMIACSGLSITGGYHRLFSHRAYKSHILLRLFYLVFGAAAVQNSALKWSVDHRRHHMYTDRDSDPYNIKRGFWWAHIGWVLFDDTFYHEQTKGIQAHDLTADPLVRWQNRYYLILVPLMVFIMPLIVGSLWGDPIGATLWVAGIGLTLLYHFTFSINSVAHILGAQPYSRRNSARDSAITAFISMGEGYHNFHHRFPSDYRNGIRFYHFDPTKWWIWVLSKLGITSDLMRTSKEKIETARLRAMLGEAEQE